MRTPALYALLLFIIGIIGATYLSLPGLLLLGVTVIATAAAIISRLVDRVGVSRLAVSIALAAGGAFAIDLVISELPVNHISRFTDLDGPVELVGEVVSEPDMRASKTFLTVAVDSLAFRERQISVVGKIRLRIGEPTMRLNYRDQIRFEGYLNKPYAGRNPGAFDYRRFLLIRGIHGLVNLPSVNRIELLQSGAPDPFIRNLVKPIRDYLIETFNRFLPEQEAAIIRGFLIGDVRMIPAAVYQRFKDTGTLHVLAASGANVAYVIATLFFLLRPFRLPRNYRLTIALVGVVVFSFLAYNQPSVVRASVMAVTALLGKLLYRDVEPLNVISFSALIILAFEPLYLFDLGFQLSFAAAYGLVLVMPTVDQRLPRARGIVGRLGRGMLLLFVGTVVAQLSVSPILLHAFHQVPLVSFISNLLIVPLVGIATASGILLALLSGVPYLNELIAACLALTLKLTLAGVNFFASLPVARLRLGMLSLPEILLYYSILLGLLSWWRRSRLTAAFVILAFVAANMLIWGGLFGGRTPVAEITFLDTWDANTVFVKEADGKRTLINGGEAYRNFDRGQAVVLPFLLAQGELQLDRILATNDKLENRQSLMSVLAGLERPWAMIDSDSSSRVFEQRIEKSPAHLILRFDSLCVLLLHNKNAVQDLSNLPATVDLVACDWSYLKEGRFGALLEQLDVTQVIITSYPTRYQSTDLLDEIRVAYPRISFWSVLEAGGIVVRLFASPCEVEVLAEEID